MSANKANTQAQGEIWKSSVHRDKHQALNIMELEEHQESSCKEKLISFSLSLSLFLSFFLFAVLTFETAGNVWSFCLYTGMADGDEHSKHSGVIEL